jgi:hypothetical protein
MDALRIIRRRHLASIIIRVVALIMIVYAAVNILWGLGTGFGLSGFSVVGAFRHAMTVFWNDMWNPFWFGTATLLPGIALVVAERRLIRWLIPVPRRECPQCGYGLRQLTTRRCPECGYEWDTAQPPPE